MKVFEQLLKHYDDKLPFAIYCKPNSDNLIGIFQQTATNYQADQFDEIGFIFTSFDGKQNILIPESQSNIIVEKLDFKEINSTTKLTQNDIETDKKFHLSLVQKGIDAINKNVFQKVVLSRKESIEVTDFDIVDTFKCIISKYPTAFRYCFFHPVAGLWLGGFSEQLLQVRGFDFETASLAGTKKITAAKNIIWTEKEIEEQNIVTDFIKNNLIDVTATIEISEAKTIFSGQLAHIKSEIRGTLKTDFNLKSIVNILHPTPAICGFPTAIAKTFILENEGYNRSFYSGFLGEINKNFETNNAGSDLFVNLRCMQVKKSEISFFAGGGIVKNSVPEHEWDETHNKIQAMKNCVIQKQNL